MTGKQLKVLRHNAMISQLDLACLLGIQQATIGDWERERNPIPDGWEAKIRQAIRETTTTVFASAKDVSRPNKEVKPPKKEKVDDALCRTGCKHWRPLASTIDSNFATRCCHYNLDTGHSRGTQPAGLCTKYDPSERKKKRRKPML